jgi:hypothetical protein
MITLIAFQVSILQLSLHGGVEFIVPATFRFDDYAHDIENCPMRIERDGVNV